ncbi:alpha/beta-hydrolase [Parathielavia appendiculata]|uniref:Alpha/beta-hydrolase n=1 Tax=Parathielavia appendiculata TaxID=2587402 RepID=A0AAN6TRL5_9PEZI|nr:alpha/beta-hydrolase [Parathielavia appendiculata]
MTFASIFQSTVTALGVGVVGYFLFLGLLTIPFFQDQAIYLHGVTLTWFKDVSVAEQWGFLRNQVTPFTLKTSDGVTLHAWHVLPLDLYRLHEEELVKEPEGIAVDFADRTSFRLLRDDPQALLVLYLHGAAGTLASGWRPPSYRAMSALAPNRIHTVAIDYRGFGSSSGSPSEQGLLTDAITLAEWAMKEAGIPPSRIVIFGQSLGTAVGIALAHHYVTKPDPVLFSGMVLVAPFADVELLTATYRIAGTIPILGPLAPFPRLLTFFNTFILHKWQSKDKLAAFVRECEHMPPRDGLRYHITIIHAQDDYDIPWSHSDQLYWHAVNAARLEGIAFNDLEEEKEQTKTMLGPAGWAAEHKTANGVIREEIAKWGLHDRIMSYPVVSLAVLRAFTHPGTSVADDGASSASW